MYFRKYKLLVIGQFNFELFLHSMVCICSLLLYLDGLLSALLILRPGSKINSLQCDTETDKNDYTETICFRKSKVTI